MKYKLAAFDMDGTLLEGYGCWVKIHRYFDTLHIGNSNLREYDEGRMDYEEFMKRDINAWLARRKVHVSEIEKILSEFAVVENAKDVIRGLREANCTTAIISSGIDILAEKVASYLGIEHVRANKLVTDCRGYLTGEGIMIVDPGRKDDVLKGLCAELHIKPNESMAVGDSKYDRSFLRASGLGIAYRGDEELRKSADVTVSRLTEILEHL